MLAEHLVAGSGNAHCTATLHCTALHCTGRLTADAVAAAAACAIELVGTEQGAEALIECAGVLASLNKVICNHQLPPLTACGGRLHSQMPH